MGLRRSIVVCVVCVARVVVAVCAAPAVAATADEVSAEAEFVARLNDARAEDGLAPLVMASDLVAVARRHSARMAASGSIYHNESLGDEVHGWTMLGENVGEGPSVRAIHEALMDSPTHRENILEKLFTEIGMGVVIDDDFIFVTQVFARRSEVTAPPKPKPKPGSRRALVPRAAPSPAPEPRPAPPPRPPRTVSLLLRMLAADGDVGAEAGGLAPVRA